MKAERLCVPDFDNGGLVFSTCEFEIDPMFSEVYSHLPFHMTGRFCSTYVVFSPLHTKVVGPGVVNELEFEFHKFYS